MLSTKKLIYKILESIGGVNSVKSSSVGTSALYHCTGTISHDQIYFIQLGNGLWFITGRVNINSFTRTDVNPGVNVTLPSTAPTPTRGFNIPCGYRAQNNREQTNLSIEAGSRVMRLSTTESYQNAQNGTLTLIVSSIVVFGN